MAEITRGLLRATAGEAQGGGYGAWWRWRLGRRRAAEMACGVGGGWRDAGVNAGERRDTLSFLEVFFSSVYGILERGIREGLV
jgi:hypothetical protein